MTAHYLGQTGRDTNAASAWLKSWQAIKQCSRKRGQRYEAELQHIAFLFQKINSGEIKHCFTYLLWIYFDSAKICVWFTLLQFDRLKKRKKNGHGGAKCSMAYKAFRRKKRAVLEMQAAGEQEKNRGNPTGFFYDKDCCNTCLGIHRGYRAWKASCCNQGFEGEAEMDQGDVQPEDQREENNKKEFHAEIWMSL